MSNSFSSLGEYYSFLEQCVVDKMRDFPDEAEYILQSELYEQIFFRDEGQYQRTGQTMSSPRAVLQNNMLVAWFEDDGYEWEDLDGEKVFPLEKWERGNSVLAPGSRPHAPIYYPQTNIVDTSAKRIEETACTKLIERLRDTGFDIY